MFGGTAVELQQGVEVAGDLGDCLGVLRCEVDFEGFGRELGFADLLGVVDVFDRCRCGWVG